MSPWKSCVCVSVGVCARVYQYFNDDFSPTERILRANQKEMRRGYLGATARSQVAPSVGNMKHC